MTSLPERLKNSSLSIEVIETAILLAAGEGSRLRSAAPLKPLCCVAGRTLLAHAISGLAEAGLARAVVVLGYGAGRIEAHIAGRSWPITVETVRVDDYRKPNGMSVLAAQHHVTGGEALLAMCDHLVDPALYRRMAQAGAAGHARLAVDRRIENDWVDLDDVTRVRTVDERIVAIGKGLDPYDCFDTGVFAAGHGLFAALRSLEAPSLTEGMRVLACQGTALTADCSDLDWIDVDDQRALEKAERWRGASAPQA
ncbi:NTP transferase domain-containing protein [Sphingomonas sp. BT-65]|uniref:phosphocholine cytidylyltransferase family protein n=1 Tax=Sphingomonas sp. BT-65 TaxID=2989821 RepID=UPI002235D68F|nr:NTP transferase domain-containing protein [Sphingomonas sp. BT-65]MCW4460720.1 NTP transferase domain-containing protein [Sphingomonas sp. BT-65]